MNSVTKYNLDRYSNDKEFDIYSTWTNHKLRIKIMVNFVDEAFSKTNKNMKNFKILDIGGNTGVISNILQEKGYNVTVADISEEALKTCKKRKLKTISFDFNSIFPIKEKTYDLVIAGDVIEHILDTELFLNECNRILNENGYLVISTPNLATFKDRIRFLFGKMPRQINPHHEYLKLHIRQFTYSSLKDSLKITGFNMLRFKSNYFVLKSFKGNPIFIRWLAILFPTLSSSLIMLAIKNKIAERKKV